MKSIIFYITFIIFFFLFQFFIRFSVIRNMLFLFILVIWWRVMLTTGLTSLFSGCIHIKVLIFIPEMCWWLSWCCRIMFEEKRGFTFFISRFIFISHVFCVDNADFKRLQFLLTFFLLASGACPMNFHIVFLQVTCNVPKQCAVDWYVVFFLIT